ncbi:hypothetical protein [Chryseobacterium paridis]|uniref:Right handed beta helix domain-containing protein n=1 Tax=Chryseobacterium paridis TaxID=2800328 RepID=A0ABS1FZ62_9FLAO|nr:hypothetical protein [Chryseobacterium paridis]MBK1897704.1 hypothetical protein [Chryseobacterium paridis]
MDYKKKKFLTFIMLCLAFLVYGIPHCENHTIKRLSKDDTGELQNRINQLKKGGILDGGNRTYYVTSLWLKSNMVIQNMKLVSIPTDVSDVSVLNIGNDLLTNIYNSSKEGKEHYEISRTYPGFSNISIKNIEIDGNRANQKNLDIRDGGKHGINIKGFANHIKLENLNIHDCATDGIAIYRGLHTNLLSNTEIFAAKNIELYNVTSTKNRRHGGSGDSISDFKCSDSKFTENGKSYGANLKEGHGLEGARYNGNLYGNGWDMEGYGLGSAISNMHFKNTSFTNNMGGGVVFYDTTNSNERQFVPRKNIVIENCIIDAGENNPSGYFSLVFSSTIESKKNTTKLYSDLRIINTKLYGKILLRSVNNIYLENTTIFSKDKYSGLLDNVSNLSYTFSGKLKTNFLWEKYDFVNVK